MKHIRFDYMFEDSYVRIQMKDGQRIEHTCGGPTEEGYSHQYTSLERQGDYIFIEVVCNSRDCDGRLDHFWEACACPKEDGYRTVEWEGVVKTTKALHYRDVERSQRDHAAEAMGY